MSVYLLTPWCRVILEKLTGLQLVKKFPAFYGTRRFITALKSVRHLSLSCASPIQCDVSPRNTPPGDPIGGVVYLRTLLSPEQASCLQVFLNMNVLQGGVVSTSPKPQAGGPPLAGCPRLLIQFIRSYPPYWRPFLYPQPEDAPCRGDRDPLHMGTVGIFLPKYMRQISGDINLLSYFKILRDFRLPPRCK